MNKYKILVVEDEQIVALDISQRLTELGYTVTGHAASGEEALQQIETTAPDMVLMDIRIKGEIDGVQTAQQVRDRFGLPVIYLTAYSDEGTLERAKATGPYGYIIKPFDNRDLKTAIDIALYRQAMEQREREHLSQLEAEIAHRKATEQALRASEQRFRTLVEQAPFGVAIYAADGQLLQVNQALKKFWGISPDELDSILATSNIFNDPRMETFNHESYAGKAFAGTTVILPATEITPPYAADLDRHETERLWLEGLLYPIKGDDNQVQQVVMIQQDVTERKHFEQQHLDLALERERVQILSDFTAQASLEFRTPLSVISLSTYLLSKVTEPVDRERNIAKIGKQVAHLTKLVEGLTTISRLDSGEPLRLSPIKMNDLVQVVAQTMQPAFLEKQLTMSLNLEEPIPIIEGDMDYLKEAIACLLDNALRFTPPGGTVTIRSSKLDNLALVEIADTGVGIAEDNLSRIFVRFFRGDSSESASGLGLGLALTSAVVDMHQGSIEVESSLGKGSVFRLRFPAQ